MTTAREVCICARLRLLFWILGIAGAIVQAVAYRQFITADSLSYLDMSDAISAHDPGRLVNATWSPLYPLVVGLVNSVLHPSPYWEFPVAHWVNFLCFLFAFATFEFLFRSLQASWLPDKLPQWALVVTGYSLFLWASLGMLTLMLPGPDMLMSGFLYLTAGLLVRIHRGQPSWKTYAALGVVLGAGYLAKAIMFPLGILALGMTLFVSAPLDVKLKRTLLAGLFFGVVAGPYVWAVSSLAHRHTFGEAGTIVHMTHVDKIDGYFQNTGTATGKFVHPMTKILNLDPPAFLFARPVPATYPFWYDPYYWSEGVRPAFLARTQAKLFFNNLSIYFGMVLGLAGVAVSAAILAYAAGLRHSIRALLSFWPICLLGVFALAAYATLYVENRYLGGFFAIIGLGLLFGLRLPRPLAIRTLGIIVTVIVLNLALNTAINLRKNRIENANVSRLNDPAAAVALRLTGVAADSSVAAVTPSMASGWARLARVHIIADIQRTSTEKFLQGTAAYHKAAFEAFAAAGCKAVVARIGDRAVAPGWQRLGDSVYAVHLLP